MKLELQNLAGQLAKLWLSQAQNMRLTYGDLPEAEQKALIDGAEKLGAQTVEAVKDLLLSQGGGVADITIHKVGINKETIEAKISMDRDDELSSALMSSAHSSGKLTFINVGKEVMSLGDRAQPAPSQGGMFTDSDDGEPLFHDDGRVNEPDNVAKIETKRVMGALVQKTPATKPKSAKVAESTKPKTTRRKSPTKSKAAPKTVQRRRVGAKKPDISELTSDG